MGVLMDFFEFEEMRLSDGVIIKSNIGTIPLQVEITEEGNFFVFDSNEYAYGQGDTREKAVENWAESVQFHYFVYHIEDSPKTQYFMEFGMSLAEAFSFSGNVCEIHECCEPRIVKRNQCAYHDPDYEFWGDEEEIEEWNEK